jgi:hypothetical protein
MVDVNSNQYKQGAAAARMERRFGRIGVGTAHPRSDDADFQAGYAAEIAAIISPPAPPVDLSV